MSSVEVDTSADLAEARAGAGVCVARTGMRADLRCDLCGERWFAGSRLHLALGFE